DDLSLSELSLLGTLLAQDSGCNTSRLKRSRFLQIFTLDRWNLLLFTNLFTGFCYLRVSFQFDHPRKKLLAADTDARAKLSAIIKFNGISNLAVHRRRTYPSRLEVGRIYTTGFKNCSRRLRYCVGGRKERTRRHENGAQ